MFVLGRLDNSVEALLSANPELLESSDKAVEGVVIMPAGLADGVAMPPSLWLVAGTTCVLLVMPPEAEERVDVSLVVHTVLCLLFAEVCSLGKHQKPVAAAAALSDTPDVWPCPAAPVVVG
jgi:hypothetical protein